MIMVSEMNRDEIIAGIRAGKIDMAEVGIGHIVDEILLFMHRKGIIAGLKDNFPDTRKRRAIPFELMLLLSIAAKMKVKTSLTDIPFAITDMTALHELGYALWDSERAIGAGLMDEGQIRHCVGTCEPNTWVEAYNQYTQGYAMKRLNIAPAIHLLDCTKYEVNLKNEHYEGATVVRDEDGSHRGYKLATLRGIYGDRGIIEDIRFDSIEKHDLTLSRDMIANSPCLKAGDILLNDRGFLSREVMNELKNGRGVDSYIPLRKGMEAYEQAVSLAKEQGKWQKHPNAKRTDQAIAFVPQLGAHWRSDNQETDVEINGCVVHDTKKDEYHVFVTTDLNVTAKQIIKTYELRPEIEEDYRQLKDFWKLEHCRSRKKTVIVFHVVCVLLGYLYFQLYTTMKEGERYAGKSLPVVIKNYKPTGPKGVIICTGRYFTVFALLELMKLYASLGADVRARLDEVLALV